MDCERNRQTSSPPLCANNCGFYGIPASNNMCSKCYREFIQRQNAVNLMKSPDADRVSAESSLSPSQQTPAEHSSDSKLSLTTSASTSTSFSSCASPTSADLTVSSAASTSSSCASQSAITHSTAPAVESNGSSATPSLGEDVSMGTVSEGLTSCSTTSSSNTYSSDSSKVSSNDTSSDDRSSSGESTSGGGVQSSTGAICPVVPQVTGESSGVVTGGAEEKEHPPKQTNKNRCWTCNSKTGLLGFQCRCGYFFCGSHRYADTHDCLFDYKSFDREQLSKRNIKVVADKVDRI